MALALFGAAVRGMLDAQAMIPAGWVGAGWLAGLEVAVLAEPGRPWLWLGSALTGAGVALVICALCADVSDE
jgi:hypothetical protein